MKNWALWVALTLRSLFCYCLYVSNFVVLKIKGDYYVADVIVVVR